MSIKELRNQTSVDALDSQFTRRRYFPVSLIMMHVINELTGPDEKLIKVQELVNFIRSNDMSFIFMRDWNISQRICSNSRWWTPLTWRWNRRQTWNFDTPLITDYWPTYRSSQDLRARSSWTRSDQSHGIRTLTWKSIFSGWHVHRLWKLDASRGISRKKRQRKRRIIAPITRHSGRKRKKDVSSVVQAMKESVAMSILRNRHDRISTRSASLGITNDG